MYLKCILNAPFYSKRVQQYKYPRTQPRAAGNDGEFLEIPGEV